MSLSVVASPIARREQLLVVRDPGELAGLLRHRYPRLEVAASPTYLSGIATLARQPVRGVVVGVDPAVRKLSQAIAGLRKAAGQHSRMVLCCRPSGEPAARQAMAAGADDYLVYPPRGEELDAALGLSASLGEGAGPATLVDANLPSWEELDALSGILADVGEDRAALLDRIARFVAETMRSAHVRVTCGPHAAQVGDPRVDPALVEPILAAGRRLGEVLVGPRQKSPFSGAEVRKLQHGVRIIAHLLDAAERQQIWQTLAMTDEVTDLPNRRYLLHAMTELLPRAQQQRSRVTVLLYDLDGFKHFNDTYGHAAGDQILRETGQLFRRHCRQHDIVARYAGDEFVVVFWDADEPRVAGSRHPTDVLAVLRRVKRALHAHEFPMLGPEAKGIITISGGLATFPWDARTPETLIARADEALREAKRTGKNHICLIGRHKPVAEDRTQP